MQFIAILVALVSLTFASSITLAQGNNDHERPKRERPSFTSIDLNQDGMVELDEFEQHDIPFGDHQTVFDRIDSNADGVIDEEEFTSHKPPHRRKSRNDIRF